MNRTIKLLSVAIGACVLWSCGESPPPSAPTTPLESAAPEVAVPETPVLTAAQARTAAVGSAERPIDDRARDVDRKPEAVLEFYDVQPGQQVLELVAGGGYFTEIFARVLGPNGHVYATRLRPERLVDAAGAPRLDNVTAIEDVAAEVPAGSIDLVFTALNYHDLVNREVDRGALLAQVMATLKPEGVLAIIDHAAAPESGNRDVGTLHRIDEAVVKSEVTAAGFALAGESDMLSRPDDARTLRVTDDAIRGKTHQFVLKFVKASNAAAIAPGDPAPTGTAPPGVPAAVLPPDTEG